jgi:hypothetical protein
MLLELVHPSYYATRIGFAGILRIITLSRYQIALGIFLCLTSLPSQTPKWKCGKRKCVHIPFISLLAHKKVMLAMHYSSLFTWIYLMANGN